MKTLLNLTLALSLLVRPAWAQSLDDTFSASTGTALTDQEQVNANNYYHQGLADQVLEAECKKLKTGCNDQTSRPGNVLGGFEDVLPKLYAVMGTLAAAGVGNKIQMRSSAPAPAPATGATPATDKPAAPEKKEKTDVCIYIPLAGEAVATFTQQQAEQQIQQTVAKNQADLQKDALYAVARTHTERAKTAKLQASIYAATGACYVAYLAMGANPKSAMLWVKMGAAAAMSAIFFKKAGKHKDYANQLKEIADKLPGAGECNPFTSTNCFCSQTTSFQTDPGNFNRFCVPKAIVNNGPPGTQVACVTLNSAGVATMDAACQCKQSNSCANAQIRSLSGQLGLGSIGFNEPLSLLDNTTGSFNEGNLASVTDNLNAATKRALNGSNGLIPVPALSGGTKAIADKIAGLGVPAGVSGLLASQQSADVPVSDALAPTMTADSTDSSSARPAQVPGYNASGGSRPSGGTGGPEFVNPLAALNKQQKPAAVQVETFAEQAIRNAEINRDSSRSLFEVISNRYRASGWGAEPSNPSP